MKKLQQYYILKFSTARLKKSKNNITITLNEARRNDEVVSLGDSQVLRTVRRIIGKTTDEQQLSELFKEKKRIKQRRDSEANRKKLLEIEDQIDNILFIPQVISVTIDDNRHYEKIIKNGLFVNGRKYVRLLCGAGNARRNTVIFIDAEIEEIVKVILNNNRKDIPLVDAKFNAYFALANSATLPISTPKFCVVPDYEVKMIKRVEFIDESQKIDQVEERDMELPFNLWDGMGIVSPAQSKEWADELELDYIPSAFCIRGSYLKGMVCTFDFHKFAKEIAHKWFITDVWGNQVDVNDVEVIITASQLKLWNGYESVYQYRDSCMISDFSWGVSRVTPKQDKTTCFSNYQFVQVLNLDDEDIEGLCSRTVEYIDKVSGGDVRFTLLYLLGELCNQEQLYDGWLDTIDDPIVKALIINNDLINDPYIKRHITSSLNKKIKDSYIGGLVLEGNFQVMISDPYAFCEYLFGLPVKGLLKEGQHYSNFWNRRGVDKIAGLRAPLTWRSEVNMLNLQMNDWTEYWYEYITSGIIYNVHGLDTMLHADSDWDFDIVCTTNQKEFVEGAYGGLPITYTKKSAVKRNVQEGELYKADMKSFNSKIGFITNCSTTLYSMLPLYEPDSPEAKEIINRLKICRKEQGNQIDKAKGIVVKKFPEYWTKKTQITDGMSEEEIKQAEFNNGLLINKRPYFMRYLYDDYEKKFKKLTDRYDVRGYGISGIGINEIIAKENRTEKEQELVNEFYKDSQLLDSPSVMNKICHHMVRNMKEIKYRESNDFEPELLMNRNIPIDEKKLEALLVLYKKYKEFKQGHNYKSYRPDNSSLVEFIKFIKHEAYKISSDESELANLAVYICYIKYKSGSKDFVWKIFGNGLIQNVMNNSNGCIHLPLLDKNGEISYLGKNYKWVEIGI